MDGATAWFERWRRWKNRKPDPERMRSLEVAVCGARKKTVAIQLSQRHSKSEQVDVLENLQASGSLAALLRATSGLAVAATRHVEALHGVSRCDHLKWTWAAFRSTAFVQGMVSSEIEEAVLPCAAYVDSISAEGDERQIELWLDFRKCVIRVWVVPGEEISAGTTDTVLIEGLTPLLSSFYIMEDPAGDEDVSLLAGLFEQSR
jgi:hypothetical protein